ncbi:MAG: Glyoxalase-like domain protein [Actinomycetia bacterium]|nr:Glyoxalase-like domain protein [Actinomycetes bacterium]
MITGIHAMIYNPAADEVRKFLADVVGFDSVDAGGGWQIFKLPPAELGVHPADGLGRHEFSLMCDDIEATMKELAAKGAEFTGPITDQGWGRLTAIRLPGGAELGLYQPRHPTAH